MGADWVKLARVGKAVCAGGRIEAEDLFLLQGKGISSGLLPSVGNAAGGGRNWGLRLYCIDKGENRSPFFFFKGKSPLVVETLWSPLPFIALSLLFSEMPLTVCADISVPQTSYYLVCL